MKMHEGKMDPRVLKEGSDIILELVLRYRNFSGGSLTDCLMLRVYGHYFPI